MIGPKKDKVLNFLVVGCGSIGQRHIRNLLSLGHSVSGYDKDPRRLQEIKKKFRIHVFNDLKEALFQECDGALICAPTSLHVSLAIEIAKKGINLFIEKPLSNDVKRLDELEAIVKRKKLVVLVGCNLRFLPSLQLVKKLITENKIGKILSARMEFGFYLPFWHPHEDYRKGYSANRHLGGGVILDDIHEIDSLVWLLGEVEEVYCYTNTVSSLDIDTEDIAEIILKLKSGAVGHIHMDYLQKTYRRQCMLIGEKGDILWDYATQIVKLFSLKTNQSNVFHKGINTKPEIMFINEMKHFINCIKGKETSVNDLGFSKKVLKVALACHRSATKKETVSL